MRAVLDFEVVFHARAYCFSLCRMCHKYWFLRFYLLVFLTLLVNVVQLLFSLSGWLHLNCSSIDTGFNGAEINCRIAHTDLGILLMNSNCQDCFLYSAAFRLCRARN